MHIFISWKFLNEKKLFLKNDNKIPYIFVIDSWFTMLHFQLQNDKS